MGTCEGLIGHSYEDLRVCGNPASTRITVGCQHEHIETLAACSSCASLALAGRRACSSCGSNAPRGHRHVCWLRVLQEASI